MAKRSEKPKENYLKIPNHIRNIPNLNSGQRELLAHIYSFGRKGCWQKNKTLGEMFFRKSRTMSLWVGKLKRGGHILWVNGKGYYRTLYAKTHPDVKSATTLLYRGREVPKNRVISGQVDSARLRNKLPSNYAKDCEITAQKPVVSLRKKLLHTNNTTTKETTIDTATSSPLPAGGQAPTLLQDRKAEQQASIEQFKQRFGKAGRRETEKITNAEFKQRKQQQLKALLGQEK